MASRSALIALLVVVSCAAAASAATTFNVGDTSGWTLGVNYDNWASGKTFTVGDKLVFTYTTGAHDVLEVSKSDYDNCNIGSALVTNTNGPTTITLTSGDHYYICSVASGAHCKNGMKLAVSVGSGSGSPSSPSTPATPSSPSTPSSPPSSSTPAAPAPSAASASPAAPALAMAAGVLLIKLALF
nr:unnamed protein product [Digitaria exilis]